MGEAARRDAGRDARDGFLREDVRVKGKMNKKIPQENSREEKLLSEVKRQLNK